MTKGFSSLANSLEASISESLNEPRILLLSLAHVLTCVVFRDVSWARCPKGNDEVDVGCMGGWHGAGQSTSSMSIYKKCGSGSGILVSGSG